jgi:hypothetical protein
VSALDARSSFDVKRPKPMSRALPVVLALTVFACRGARVSEAYDAGRPPPPASASASQIGPFRMDVPGPGAVTVALSGNGDRFVHGCPTPHAGPSECAPKSFELNRDGAWVSEGAIPRPLEASLLFGGELAMNSAGDALIVSGITKVENSKPSVDQNFGRRYYVYSRSASTWATGSSIDPLGPSFATTEFSLSQDQPVLALSGDGLVLALSAGHLEWRAKRPPLHLTAARALAAGDVGIFRRRDIESGFSLDAVVEGGEVSALSLSHDGSSLAVGRAAATELVVFAHEDAQWREALRAPFFSSGQPSSLVLSASGEWLVAQANNNGFAVAVYQRVGRQWRQTKSPAPSGHPGFGDAISISADGSVLAIASPAQGYQRGGKPGEFDGDTGSVAMFERLGDGWSLTTTHMPKSHKTLCSVDAISEHPVLIEVGCRNIGFGKQLAMSANGGAVLIEAWSQPPKLPLGSERSSIYIYR